MNTEQALAFLAEHQPMPADGDISESECDAFCALLQHFEEYPDPRCLPLLINSVSNETGLGMYENIRFVLLAHNEGDVAAHLLQGLTHGNDGVKYRCCWWAGDVMAWDLADAISPLTEYEDEDVREAAAAFLELRADAMGPDAMRPFL